MKAIVRHMYGSPDVLHVEEAPKPTVGDDDVLVKPVIDRRYTLNEAPDAIGTSKTDTRGKVIVTVR
jgi:NADPH:quinone reductase-like Zn-dependent oxidoreductase